MPDPAQYPTVDIQDMGIFVLKHASESPHLDEYLNAVKEIQESRDPGTIKKAFTTLQRFNEETNEVVWIGGLEGLANDVAARFGEQI